MSDSEINSSDTPVIRLAMWSGPRNISTAMMRAFENRPDCVVWDEPLYAHYLKVTGLDHPGAEEVIAHHESNWERVIDRLLGPLPTNKTVFYQKHMAHHLLPMIDRGWLAQVTNVFLIREPKEMLTSLMKITPNPTAMDTGLPQQIEIFDLVRAQTGTTPPILDSRDVLENPRRMLGLLCDAVGISFDEAMLNWPAGPRESDGIWAKHWYDSVWKSTGFAPYRPKNEEVPAPLQTVLDECNTHYAQLYDLRLR